MSRDSATDRIWIATSGALTTVAAAILSLKIFGGIPHVQDSVAQLFQARIFAGGHLYAPSPPLRQFFDYAHMINDGRWYSQYPPGHALFLVPGIWLGIPWLVNPVMAGLGVIAAGLLAREVFGSATARITVTLGLLSPFLLFMAAEYMSHVSGFALLTFFLYFAVRLLRTGRPRDGLWAGIFLGLAVPVRPYTAAGVAAPVFLHQAWRLYKDRRRSIHPLLVMVAGGAAGSLLLGLYQMGTTGDPFLPGYIKLYGPSHGLGFGKGTWGPPHTLVRGFKGAWDNVTALSPFLFGWPLTSLWPLLLALLPWPRQGAGEDRREGPARDANALRWLLLAVPLAVLLAYVFYWYHDLCFGPRYLYETLGAVLALSGYGFHRLGRLMAGRIFPRSRGWRRSAPGVLLGTLLFAYAFAVAWPSYMRMPAAAEGAPPESRIRQASYFQYYGPDFWGVSPYLGRLVRDRGLTNALVFVRLSEPESDFLPLRHLWFGSAFAQEEPDLSKAKVIFARDRGEEDKQLARLFPGREVYLYSGSIESGELWRIPLEGSR